MKTNINQLLMGMFVVASAWLACQSSFEAGVDDPESGGGRVGGLGVAPPMGGTMGLGVGGAAPGVIASATCTITQLALPARPPNIDSTGPTGLIVGPDGNLWFAEPTAPPYGAIARITPDGTISEFPLAYDPAMRVSAPDHLAVAHDGTIWFAGGEGLGRIRPDGTFLEPPISGMSLIFAVAIVAGPDGNMWVTDQLGKIHRISPSGQDSVLVLPNVRQDTHPYNHWQSIVTGPDGNLWFTQLLLQRLGRYTPRGTLTEYAMPDYGTPRFITAGPDGNLWFTEVAGAIGRITPRGEITEFPLAGQLSLPWGIAAGPDGNLWFTGSSRIGYITTDGAITECQSLAFTPNSIVAGPDGHMWFTGDGPDVVGHVSLNR